MVLNFLLLLNFLAEFISLVENVYSFLFALIPFVISLNCFASLAMKAFIHAKSFDDESFEWHL